MKTFELLPEDFFDKYPALKLIGNTPMVELDLFKKEYPGVKISGKAEFLNPGGSVKDRPVLMMLAKALISGELKPGQTILDSSSGNAGIAYSMIGDYDKEALRKASKELISNKDKPDPTKTGKSHT